MKNIYLKDEHLKGYYEAKRLILEKDNTLTKLSESDTIGYLVKYFLDKEKRGV